MLAIGLLRSAIIIIEFTTKQSKPFLEFENFVVVKVTGSTFDHENLLVGKVLGQSACSDTASCTTTNNDIVKVINLR